jgi:hypothetical protein
MINVNCTYWYDYGKCSNKNVKRYMWFFKPICIEIYSASDYTCPHKLKCKRPSAPPPPPKKVES